MRPTAFSARISANAGVVQRRRRCSLRAKYLENQQAVQPRRCWECAPKIELKELIETCEVRADYEWQVLRANLRKTVDDFRHRLSISSGTASSLTGRQRSTWSCGVATRIPWMRRRSPA